MVQFFSDDSMKRIAQTVRRSEESSTDITTAPIDAKGYGPMRICKLVEFNEGDSEAPADDLGVTRYYCDMYVYDFDTTDKAILKQAPTEAQEYVHFLFPPDQERFYQTATMGGMRFAIQDRTFAVVLQKTNGQAGDHQAQCDFTYDVFTCNWSEGEPSASTFKIGSDVDPTASGMYVRPALGKLTQASHGLAIWRTGKEFSIVWCNEIFEVALCTSGGSSNLNFGGVYDPSKSYRPNTLVLDGPYQMISNATTRERPAPQPTGEPQTKIGTVPTWAQVSGTGRETITGQRYTWSSAGQLSMVRVYIPSPSGGGGGGGGGGGPGGGTP